MRIVNFNIMLSSAIKSDVILTRTKELFLRDEKS